MNNDSETNGKSSSGFAEKLLDLLLRQPPSVVAGALLGAFGIVNVVDSLVVAYLGVSWELIPDIVRPLFDLFRAVARGIVGFLTGIFSVQLPPVWQDYLAMGFIVAGMRYRSTTVILEAVAIRDIREYREVVLGRSLVLKRTSPFTIRAAFITWRLATAFLLWPAKLFGAATRYATGNLRDRMTGPEDKVAKVRERQYMTFFGSVVWALFFVLLFLMVNAGGAVAGAS